jgi:hypothetical protein
MEDSGCHNWWAMTAAAMPRKMPPGGFPPFFDLISFSFYFSNAYNPSAVSNGFWRMRCLKWRSVFVKLTASRGRRVRSGGA